MSTVAAPEAGYREATYHDARHEGESYKERLYKLDARTRDLLVESAPLMAKWARTQCKAKADGGMEEWAKKQGGNEAQPVIACDWYHGTWQYLRLLDMVAVPPWYGFYSRALASALKRKPRANVLISACADYGMVATLHEAIQRAEATPKITVCDICNTPLLACQWYAKRHGLEIECVCDNIITSRSIPLGAFDLIVTDEFLTVLKAQDKPLIAKRWKQLLRPGGALVTTAMIGGPTTPELRKRYAESAGRRLQAQGGGLRDAGLDPDEMMGRIGRFAGLHTRHMVTDEKEIQRLFEGFYLGFVTPTATAGECVNPTYSFQIVASLPHQPPSS